MFRRGSERFGEVRIIMYSVQGSIPPGKKRFYSAPAALCIITGCTYSTALKTLALVETAYALSLVSGDTYANSLKRIVMPETITKYYKNTTSKSINHALNFLGWKSSAIVVRLNLHELILARLDDCRIPKLPTLAHWLKIRSKGMLRRTYLILLRDRYIVIHGRNAADCYTIEPVCIKNMHFKQALVTRIWSVKKIREKTMNIDRYPELGIKMKRHSFEECLSLVRTLWPDAYTEGSTGAERTFWSRALGQSELVGHCWPLRNPKATNMWVRIKGISS